MKSLTAFLKKGSEDGYGRATFIASVIFATSSIFMYWSERYAREKRQAGVKEFLKKQQQQNMANYKKQRQRINER
ncbi:unnamed protein product [Gongylonema pulchrum]|uniref:Uncharacterized protein n=1 Tax=Gongylonema pulchrum TaxID=637853 RepID=A0A183DY75_9BILA|nr:unnamed protein product [Gongylonema pulchrum]VDN24307.1 unnamed protein product [Gongylonema pulchrum]